MTNKQNQSESQDDLNAVFAKIQEVVIKSANGDYIYRGEPECFEKVSSNLYRQYEKEIETEHFDIEVVQEEILNVVENYVSGIDKGFELMTQLQHYGGKTNLIDFTTDYLRALFFACDGSHHKDGRIILLQKTEEIKEKYRVEEPWNPQNRVIAQKSIFVRPPKGYIEPEQYDKIKIPKYLKIPMLNYLRKYHGISTKTIYNDLHGFITTQKIHQSAYTEFFKGLTYQNRGDSDKAIGRYTETLERNPLQVEAYYNRGLAYYFKKQYDRAIKDFTNAIELKPDYADAYNSRGVVYQINGDN